MLNSTPEYETVSNLKRSEALAYLANIRIKNLPATNVTMFVMYRVPNCVESC